MARLYFYIEDLGLTAGQRATILDQLKALSPNLDRGQPCERNHSRVRLDNKAAIFEADWVPSEITALAIRQRLATLFGVALANIAMATTTTQIGAGVPLSEVATYSYNSAQKLRLGVFAGRDASWGESWQAVTAYLKENQAAWESAGA